MSKHMNTDTIELLAPAGSYEALTAAIQAGADAVYVGGSRFGARAYANNLDQDQLCEAIDLVHLHGKKLYLTVNTLLKEPELTGELYEYLKPYYERGLDAVIVQDYGVFRFIRENFSDLPIHASTQMTITGPMGASLLEKEGATRIVTARELSLEDIRAIRSESRLEIESFVHGALCYCYSGQCLFSSMIGGRSGNRGRCAQPCRQAYEVWENGKTVNNKSCAYPLNTKDMCTIEILPQIIQAGVTSLKIEGRMKKPEYTAGVVSIYRKYLDLYLQGEKSYQVEKKDLQILYDLFNRDGFHQSYYLTSGGREMMALQNKKNEEGKKDPASARQREKTNAQMLETYVQAKKQEKINGSFTIYSDSPAILTVYLGEHTAAASCDGVVKARNRPLTKEAVEKQLRKTGQTPYQFDHLEIFMGDDVFLPLQSLNEVRRQALQNLTEELLRPYQRTAKIKKSQTAQREKKELEKSADIHVSIETEEQLRAALLFPQVEGIYLSYDLYQRKDQKRWLAQMEEAVRDVQDAGKKVWIAMPYVWKEKQSREELHFFKLCDSWKVDGYLVRNLESFCFLKKLGKESQARLDYCMYTWNHMAQEYWRLENSGGDTIPYELNYKEMLGRDNADSELLVYGRVPMMVSAQCIKKNLEDCTHSHASLVLKDRIHAEFPVQCCCNTCYNVIYNSVPLSLLRDRDEIGKLKCAALRLAFTTENYGETSLVLKATAAGWQEERAELKWPVTRGHFKRSVE
ncbi:MAG: U32 family peptidase [Lachnospiraceae bacterium]|nr:U32 family peptidase [Lachnospiraceae bacterium]